MGKIDLENFPTSECAKEMLGYVTNNGFYDRAYVGKWLFQVMGLEYDEAHKFAEELPLQMFPETATWGLKYHEIKWHLPVRKNLSYEERRKLIYQRRDDRPPMTPDQMETNLANATGFEVHIADIHDVGEYGWTFTHPNRFRVMFMGEGSLDAEKAREILNRLKQSHTAYTIDDMMIIVFDNQELEQLSVPSMELYMVIRYWNMKQLDGLWKLDGSNMLDSVRVPFEKNSDIIIKGYLISNHEYISGDIIIKKDLWFMDGSRLLDGQKKIDAEIIEEVL
ncbi:MAG: DUF2313 domain-containing protein [Lachnospiraceae bacterium]|nr:DUF2313 domain-containing protein [Lachnospiraceae bacterium]